MSFKNDFLYCYQFFPVFKHKQIEFLTIPKNTYFAQSAYFTPEIIRSLLLSRYLPRMSFSKYCTLILNKKYCNKQFLKFAWFISYGNRKQEVQTSLQTKYSYIRKKNGMKTIV